MATEILMPALSPTMEEGTLAKWLKAEGDEITAGDVIAEIETDKATMELEAVDEGILGRILVAEGTEGVKVNAPIAVLLAEGESADDIPTASAAPQAEAATKASAGSPADAPATPETAAESDTSDTVPGRVAYAPGSIGAPEPARLRDWPEDIPTRTMTVREALRDALAEEMRRDDSVYLMGEEVAEYEGAYKISQGLLDEFGPRRVVDTTITEHGFTGIAIGSSWNGLRPVLEFMTFNFAMQAMDQIVNSAAKTLYMSGGQMGSPIVFRGPNGAAARVAAQHSQDFAAWYMQVPGLKVVMPYSAADAKGLLKTAIRDDNPVVFLENEILYGHKFEVPEDDDFTIPLGRARIEREGTDVTLVSFGISVGHALAAAEQLAEMGIEAEVINLRSLRPMDLPAIIASVQKTNRCVTIEEGWPQGSVGSWIAARVMQEAFDWLDAPVLNCTGKDVPLPYAANLEKLALVTVDEIIAAVRHVTYR